MPTHKKGERYPKSNDLFVLRVKKKSLFLHSKSEDNRFLDVINVTQKVIFSSILVMV